MRFQFNKTAMQALGRDLKMRQRALPTLKAKETALRMEIQKIHRQLDDIDLKLKQLYHTSKNFQKLWNEYPQILGIDDLELAYRNVAGVHIPELKNISFTIRDYSLYANRAWVPGATELLKEFMLLTLQQQLIRDSLEKVQDTRKKTTQKVNLYEKVQIPGYIEAIRKIKRFLEDQENLARAAQKIVKERNRNKEIKAGVAI